VRFELSEFMEKHSVSKLIGSPPGYVGTKRRPAYRTREAPPYSVVLRMKSRRRPGLFKHPVAVFEDGQLQTARQHGRFKNTIIIMNVEHWARHLQKREGFGFQSTKTEMFRPRSRNW